MLTRATPARHVGWLSTPPLQLDGRPADAPPQLLFPRLPAAATVVARIVGFLLLLAGATVASGVVISLLRRSTDISAAVSLTGALTQIAVGVVTYTLYVRLFERRWPPVELAGRRAGGLLAGLAVGAVLNAVCVGLLTLVGSYSVVGTNNRYAWLTPVMILGPAAAVFEEVLFRGVLFRFLEQGLGTWAAVAVSGALFGFVHLSNADATLQGAASIAVAGAMFGVLYALTRSLWVTMGVHAAWNVVQGPVFGITVSGSGLGDGGWLVSRLDGPTWLSGGVFGMEASILTVAVLAAFTGWLGVLLVRHRQVVAPAWRRRARAGGQLPASPTSA